MIWSLGVICLVHNVQSSLPAMAEVMSRTRWCMGKGAHCPINLPFDFPSCCEPFICTVVPRTRKPTMFLKFTTYKDYRCLLPPTTTKTPSDQVAINKSGEILTTFKPESNEIGNDTFPKVFKDIEVVNNSASVSSESSEEITNNSVAIISNENSSVDNNQYDSLSLNESSSVEHIITTDSQNDKRDIDSREVQVEHIVKRSVVNDKANGSKTKSSFEMRSTSAEVTDMNQLSKEEYTNEVDYYNVSSQSESNEMSALDKGVSKTQNSTTLNSSESLNDSLEGEALSTSNVSAQFDDVKASEVNDLGILENNTLSHLIVSSSPLNKEPSIIMEDPEEDWHSSQMHVDNRPYLKKVAIIPPFSLSKNVKTIKLNESIETSGE